MLRERLRHRFPMLYAFGEQRQTFLDNDSAAGATVEARVRSVWPFIVRRALAFHGSLKGREKVNFDLEDVIAELWVALARKDHKWSPERGRYITFAGAVIDSELCSIRDRARTVESPRNSSCRMKAYLAEEAEGTLTARRRKTAGDILRSSAALAPIAGDGRDFDHAITDEPIAKLIAREDADVRAEGLRSAIERLAPDEAEVLVRLSGIFGHDPETVRQVATTMGLNDAAVRKVKSRAIDKVRKHLLEVGHPAAHELN